VVDWKSRLLKPTAQGTPEISNGPVIDAFNGISGRLGGALGMAWFGFCLLSPVFCLLCVTYVHGLLFDGRDNTLEECETESL